MQLRKLTSAHEEALILIAFHERCSAETQYQRFFAAKPNLRPDEAGYLCDVDGSDRGAIIAADYEGGAIHGVGRWDAIDTHHTEVALVGEDDYQGQGLGTKLLRTTIRAARRAGYTKLVGEVLTANLSMRHRLDQTEYPLTITQSPGGTLSCVVDISATQLARASATYAAPNAKGTKHALSTGRPTTRQRTAVPDHRTNQSSLWHRVRSDRVRCRPRLVI